MTTRKEFIAANADRELRFNSKGQLLVLGCNYHTTWQSNKSMRFVLEATLGNKAFLSTRTTNKEFTTDIDDLIFITTKYNKNKAVDYTGKTYREIIKAIDKRS